MAKLVKHSKVRATSSLLHSGEVSCVGKNNDAEQQIVIQNPEDGRECFVLLDIEEANFIAIRLGNMRENLLYLTSLSMSDLRKLEASCHSRQTKSAPLSQGECIVKILWSGWTRTEDKSAPQSAE